MEPRESSTPVVHRILSGCYEVNEAWGAQWRALTWRPRGTDSWLLDCTISGMGRFRHPKNARFEHEASTHTLTLLRPGAPHNYGVHPDATHWNRLWVHFHPPGAWLPWLDWPAAAPGIMHLRPASARARRRIVRSLWKVHRFAASGAPLCEAFALNALEETLLWCRLENPLAERSLQDTRVRGALEYIRAHAAESISIEDAARGVGLSASRLAHLFQHEAGTTFQQQLEMERFEKARQLLEMTPQAVKVIAHQVGFSSQAYFARRFRERFGMSPREYRGRKGEGSGDRG